MTEHYSTKPYLCYKIALNIIVVETFYTDKERQKFLEDNKDYQPINSVLIKGIPNEAA